MSAALKRILVFLGILTLLFSANLGFETHRANPVGWVLFVIGVLGTAAGAIYLGVTMVRQSIRLDNRDISLWLLVPGVMVVGLCSPLEFKLLPEILPRTQLLQVGGIAISLAGILLAIIGGRINRQIPKLEKPSTKARPTRKQTALFSTGLCLAIFGVAVCYSSLAGLAGSLLLILPGAILRHKFSID